MASAQEAAIEDVSDLKNVVKAREWMGSEPILCDVCAQPITTEFVDGHTKMGPWAMMCQGCHKSHGRGLGIGRGQMYAQAADGKWIKTS